jgi:hypothetical protein
MPLTINNPANKLLGSAVQDNTLPRHRSQIYQLFVGSLFVKIRLTTKESKVLDFLYPKKTSLLNTF